LRHYVQVYRDAVAIKESSRFFALVFPIWFARYPVVETDPRKRRDAIEGWKEVSQQLVEWLRTY
jgi:hypothetical protein